MALPKSIAFFEKLWYNTDKFFENAATAGERRAALGQVALEERIPTESAVIETTREFKKISLS